MPEYRSEKTITIVGAGPMGLEAALYGKAAGYNVRVLEKANIAHHVRQWQHVTLFSHFGINHSPLGKKVLSADGWKLPENSAYLSGKDYLDRYLIPLAETDYLKEHIITGCEVLAISRQRILKNDHIGDGQRRRYPFRILVRYADGREDVFQSDYLIDTSGAYSNPNWLGEGGIPAIGELANRQRIVYNLKDITGKDRNDYAGKTTLVIGGGYSAGTTIAAFRSLLEASSETQVIWLTRHARELPLQPIPNDSLPEREKVVKAANAATALPNLRRIKNAVVQSLAYNDASRKIAVTIATADAHETVEVDRIIANVGFSPDNHIYRELQVHECYASRGPMKLSAALLGESSADCMAQGSKGADVLKNPEPDFYILGMKSYGKNSNFLLKVGYEQIRDAYQLISGENSLDLYQADQIEKVNLSRELA